MKRSVILSLLILLLSACSHVEKNSVQDYLALAPAEVNIQAQERVQALKKLYDQLEDGLLEQQIVETYAEKLYFNDTLVTLHDRQSLLRYLKHTQQQLDDIKFDILDIENNGQDSYVRWLMQTRFRVMGQDLDIHSIGMSHLRFDAAGKIILHQDYWDSMQGFYYHLPLIGGILQWIKNGLYD